MADEFNRAKELFEWNKRVFAVIGVWPLQPTYVKFTMSIVYLLIHMSMEFVDLFYVFGNLELMILNLSESTLHVMILMKLIVIRFSGTLAKLTKRVMDGVDAKFFDNREEKEMYLNYNCVAKKYFKRWLTMGITTGVVYHMRPLEFRLKAVLQNESMPFVLPYRTRLFFHMNDSSTFWSVWVYQIPMIYMGMFHATAISYLFSLVLHVCGLLSVLSFKIKNLDLHPCENLASSRIIFRNIVGRHRNILGLARDINAVFGLLLLEELVITTLLIGLASYSVLVNVDVQETTAFLSFLLYVPTLLLLIYGYCLAGDYLITESTNMHEAYYQCRWYDMSNSFEKGLTICMLGTSRPIILTGGGFYIFSLVSFMSILKTSAGYISMLRTIV